jgi:hypothetical protein
MIDASALLVPVSAGAVLSALGLIPGWFQRVTECVLDACNRVASGVPHSSRLDDRFRQPAWLAGLGALLIVVVALAYVSV